MKYNFEQKLYEAGYKLTDNAFCGERVFIRYDGENSRVIITAERFQVPVESPVAVREIKRRTLRHHPELSGAEILFVAFGDPRDLHDYGTNSICVDSGSGKLKHVHVGKEFAKEYALLKEVSREKKRLCAQMDAITGARKTRWFRYGFVYLLFAALNVFVYWRMFLKNSYAYGISTETVLYGGEWARLITYMVLHSGIAHLVSNTISLLVIGKQFEQRNGGLCLFFTYVFGGIMAGYASVCYNAYFKPEAVSTVTIGASGAIFALVGALLMDILTDPNMQGRRTSMVRYCILVLILSNIGVNIDRSCHIGGFLFGMALYFIFDRTKTIVYDIKYIRNAKIRKEGIVCKEKG